ncbi:CPBP family intramembrane glutamic endopeptidase [Haloarchaeobius amylolyticus]|uniref:CPBP family intramembrane glutamic endopeptidase n=1 Tax=Haloarchaeobius amylolyticus TaxID=1198296 RepID=UPI002271EBDD|nr:CPBP family intramembrane glutamic endopeptidase [Haloarchaeobius amylolyticus]
MASLNGILRNDAGTVRAGWRLLLGLVVGLPAVLVLSTLANRALTLPWSATAANAAATVAALGVVVGLSRLDGRSLTDYGLGFEPGWRGDLLVGVAVGGLIQVVAFAVLLAAGWASITGWFVAGTGGLLQAFVAFALAFCLVGVWEETYFRGFLLTTLAEALPGSDRTAVWAATLLSGTFFGLLHLSQSGLGLSILFWVELGVVLGALYVLTGRLALAIGFHAGVDVLTNLGIGRYGETPASVVVAADVTGPAWATGIAGAVNVVVTTLGAAVVLWWAIRREEDEWGIGRPEPTADATAD